jgi:tetratricopeptide (TPR) repeat protein
VLRYFVIALAFAGVARPAHAGDPGDQEDRRDQALRDVDAALAAQAKGAYDEAIKFYTHAYDLAQQPEVQFDLGEVYRLKGDLDKAYDSYMKYLEAEPNGRMSKDAAHWAGELEKQMAARKGEGTGARKRLPVAKPSPPPHHSRLAAWYAAGAAVATGGAALAFDLWGNSTYDSAVKETDPNRQVSLWHDANTKRYTADVFAVGSVGCAAVAVWLFLRSDAEPSAIASIGAHDFTISWTRAW